MPSPDRLPLAEQIARLAAALAVGDPAALLLETAALDDPEPLAWLCAKLAERGWLAAPGHRALLAKILLKRPDTALDRALRALSQHPSTHLSALLDEMQDALGPERISTLALLDRVLRRADPAAWRRRLSRLERSALDAASLGQLPEIDALARLPAAVWIVLRGVAERAGIGAALNARQAELAEAVYAALAGAPKGLSQTNAEALLSKQVYTEPGHFLIELLQNAVDTGAKRLSVRYERERVVLHHDGRPFDALDVVGVCSIGQTTKRHDQIGFFGVGFKSVYELTDRPRVYSDAWNFEIADVSVPRPLANRPAELPAGGTVIVLPLRPGLDPARSPRALYEKAARLDACILLTLPGLEHLELSLAEPALHRGLHLQKTHGGLLSVVEEPGSIIRFYRVVEREHTRSDAAPGRPERTTVKLGACCDAEGRPRPMPPEARGVYSYLPTEERSGLRFWVQGHFDVPVDRERIHPESAWNQDIIGLLPTLIGDLCRQSAPEHALAFAELLPIPADIENPLWRPVAEALPEALAELPLLPEARGPLRPALGLIVADPAIAALFDGEPLAGRLLGASGSLAWLHADASERVRELATTLGATPLNPRTLLDAVERWLQRVPDGAVPTDPELPAWILRPDPRKIMALVQLLLTAPRAVHRVAALPMLPGDLGGLHRAHRLNLAEGGVRRLLSGLTPLTHPDLDDDDARATLARVGVREVHAAFALGVLERLLAGHSTLEPDGAPLGRERLRRAWLCFAEAPPELARRALHLPLILCEDDHFYSGKDAALRAKPGPFTNALRVLYGGVRPVAIDDPALDAWLARAGAESFDVETLLQDLGTRLIPERGRIQAFHAALAEHGRTLPSWTLELLVQQPLWPTVSGAWRPIAELADAPALLALCAPGSPERAAMDGWITSGPALDSLRALHFFAKPRPAADVARELVRRFARAGEPPERQVPLLSEHRAELAAILREADPAAEVPLLDATGRLRAGRLFDADPATRALLRGLPNESMLVAVGEPGLAPQVSPLPALELLRAMSPPRPERLPALYTWILGHEGELMADPACRSLLADAPLLRSAQGRLVAARDLVLDPELPKLGIDALPAPEVPDALIRLLVRHLGVGQLTPKELILRHLRPAYQAAVLRDDREAAAALLDTLLRRVQALSATAARELLHDLPIQDASGRFRSASAFLHPDPRIAEEVEQLWPHRPRPAHLAGLSPGLLAEMGLRSWPDEAELREALARVAGPGDAIALAGVLGALRDEALLDRLPLRTHPWLPDGAGHLRHPESLYQRGAEVEALIGEDPSLFPDERATARMSPALLARLALGGPERVGPDEVIAHLARQAERGQAISPRVYAWMERGLATGRFRPELLRDRLARRPWILSDEGRLLPAERILGFPALHLFGLRRGAWSQGARAWPLLAAAFSIPTAPGPEVVAAFLAEIAREVSAQGDAAVLAAEPGLPRLLLACFDVLGRAEVPVARDLPVLPAVAAKGGPPRLVPANTPGLYRSDTPTLEALFAPVGPLLLAGRGEREQAAGVEQFLERMGVPRLRGAWRAHLDADDGDENGPSIAELRGILRALSAVLPRVRAWRSDLSTEGWTWRARLNALAASAPIRGVRHLQVRLELPGVGSANARMDAVWDPQREALFVDQGLLNALPERAALLAEGIMPCVYEGPGEELLVEILEILLPLGAESAMRAYLDRRHFPGVSEAEDPQQRLRVRVGEILDYGVGKLLVRRFDALKGADPERWREPALLRSLPAAPAEAASTLLRALGAPETGPHADELLRLLSARHLSDAFSAPAAPEPAQWKEPPKPGVRTTVASPPPPKTEPTLGFFERLRQSLFGQSLFGQKPSLLPVWARPNANPFAPTDTVTETLWATPEAQRLAAETRSPGRLEFLPAPLPRPYLYVISALVGEFDPSRQSWRPGKLLNDHALAPLQPTAFLVSFTGTLPPGLCRLPLPMYAVLEGAIEVLRGPPGAVDVPEPSGGGWSVQVSAPEPVFVRFTARLCALPTPDGAPLSFPHLTTPTLPRAALPEPVRRWLEAQNQAAPPVERARSVERFVRENYTYDRDYLTRGEVIAARSKLRAGRGHHVLEVLHASAGGGLLGRGMCGELNALVVELGRHLGVPMALASGWMTDLGWLERPDHLFAVALLSSSEGLCWMPLDAARSHDLGALQPMGPPAQGPVAPPLVGAWQEPEIAPPRASLGAPVGLDEQLRAATRHLDRALRLTCEHQALPLPPVLEEARFLPPAEANARLVAALEAALPQPELAAAVVALVRGDYEGLERVPPEARALQALGLATVERAAMWRVRPVK